MKPKEFLEVIKEERLGHSDGVAAEKNDIKLFTCDGEFQILSYYWSPSNNCMVLDIEKVPKKRKKQ